jgi:hypothetical protein
MLQMTPTAKPTIKAIPAKTRSASRNSPIIAKTIELKPTMTA